VQNIHSAYVSHESEHLYFLDGFRGLLALWVYLGHLSYAVGYKNYILGMHALAVDLFMVLSGFLMVHSWQKSQTAGLPPIQMAWKFYKTRFFRIAPLYYFLLLICYLFLTQLAYMSDFIQKVMPPPWAEGMDSYDPHAGWNFNSLRWLYLHATFTFGLVPGMEASTPLPDWSLSLEMQFYLLFPVLLICLRRAPILLLATIASSLALISPHLFGNYLTPGVFAHFGQPSFLPYRLNAFMAGMMVAYYLAQQAHGSLTPYKKWIVVLACIICVITLSKPVIVAFILFSLLALRKISFLSTVLAYKPLKRLGDISYSLYLSHLLIVTPIVYWLFSLPDFLPLPPLTRFSIATACTVTLIIPVSYLLYRLIEVPFIRLGKRLSL
jgi:peptidoglycan/LPS O-acetylase OafA/YrhL